jgi:hypothetical protein
MYDRKLLDFKLVRSGESNQKSRQVSSNSALFQTPDQNRSKRSIAFGVLQLAHFSPNCNPVPEPFRDGLFLLFDKRHIQTRLSLPSN